jgi:hypothetical protein
MSHTKAIRFVLAVFFLSINGCAHLPQFSSERCTKRIVIDGDNSDWNGISAYIDKNNIVAVSMCRDDEYVYVCMITGDTQTQRKIMAGGMTVWFDRSGEDGKNYGINYPLGKRESEPFQKKDDETGGGYDASQYILNHPPPEMEIVGSKETDRYLLPQLNNEGIQVEIGKTKDREMVYELKVPLKKTTEHPHAVEPKGDFIGLGFETGAISGYARRRTDNRGNSSGMEGGGLALESETGGGLHGNGRMHQGRAAKSGSLPEALKIWWKVKL